MKKILSVLLALFITIDAHAQTVSDDLRGYGMSAELSDYIAGILPAGSVLGNNTYLKGRNAANSADINVLKIDASDNTVLNSSASDVLILQLEDDASRLINFSAASDAALIETWGDGGTTATQVFTIQASTADADDDSTLILAGGGGTAGTRGATITIRGEEVTNGGDITYNAGTGDTHSFAVAGTAEVTLSDDAITYSGASGTLAFGATSGIFSVNGNTELTLTDDALTFAGASSALAFGATSGIVKLNGNTELTLTDDQLAFAGAAAEIVPGATSISFKNNADSAVNLGITDAGVVTARAGLVTTTGNVTSTAGDIVASTSGGTLALQEATAGAKCMGSLTANGSTPVVTATTCALTNSRILLSRTSAETGVVQAWLTAITNATSFEITGEAGDTGTYNWIIFHEAA